MAPAREVNTGEYLPYAVTIRDARPRQADFTLASHGFMLTRHRSAVRNFFDKEEVNAIYLAEVAASIRQITGADRVATLGWMVRTSGDLSAYAREEVGYQHQGGVQPPAGEAHVDSSPDRVPNTMFVVDKIPEREEMLRPMPDEDKAIAAAIFQYRPQHRWWYFSNMTREEALVFKFHDSRRVRPWRVPHTAFFDNTRPDARPRESIEARSIAYFR